MVNGLQADLISIKPLQEKPICPQCGNGNGTDHDILFEGIHTIVKWKCISCEKIFFHTLPTGHDFLFPISFDETGDKIFADDNSTGWLVQPLMGAMFRNARTKAKIKKELIHQQTEAIILNCLDNCFGHTFSKLWNASILKNKYPDKSIIIFIPASMRWLVPDGISEVWSCDNSFSDLEKYINNLDEEVKQNLFPRFQKIWMSKAYTHLDLSKVDLKAMLRTNRFDLSKFNTVQPSITFTLREDRFWHRCPFEFFLFKVFVKLRLSKKIFIWRQNYLVNRAATRIKRKIGNITFSAAGLGKTGKLLSIINDKRKIKLASDDENDWCKLYAGSHIIIGVHGSNMLIPSALSAGFIEILPRHKIRHIAEDTLIDYNSRYTLFLGRHVDQFASPRLIAEHATSMIMDFPYLHKNTEQHS